MSRHKTPREQQRTSGLTLVEISVAMTILVVIGVSTCIAMVRGMQHRQESFRRYRALAEVRDFLAGMQDVVNQKQDLLNQKGVGATYAKYEGKSYSVSGLSNGSIAVTCYGNEQLVPTVFGGPQDLNFDGDADDNLTAAPANGEDLKLVPVEVTLTYSDGVVNQTLTVHRLLTQTTN